MSDYTEEFDQAIEQLDFEIANRALQQRDLNIRSACRAILIANLRYAKECLFEDSPELALARSINGTESN